MNHKTKSLFVAIEGGDGSGKATQAKKLAQKAKKEGWDVFMVSFPRYGQLSAEIIEKYLNGAYGKAQDVHPDLASLPYALDRYAASSVIRNHLEKPGALVIADRYTASNMAHQGAKLGDAQKRHSFYTRIMAIEYQMLGIVRPDLNIVLTVPGTIAYDNVSKKETRSYTLRSHDIHEADKGHLEMSRANYHELCELYPDEFVAVECMQDDDRMRPIEAIHQDIWRLVESSTDY